MPDHGHGEAVKLPSFSCIMPALYHVPVFLKENRMFRRIFVSVVLVFGGALVLAGCAASDAPANNASTTNATNRTTTTTTTTSTPAMPASSPASTTAASGDKIGIPECDDFLEKYEECVSDKVPEAARAQFNSSLKQWRDSWRTAASTPQGKASLAQGCKMVADQSRQSMKSFGCVF